MFTANFDCYFPSNESSIFSNYDPEFRRGSLQLWQFLIALLEDPNNCAAITWTGRGMEFKLIEPEEVSTWL